MGQPENIKPLGTKNMGGSCTHLQSQSPQIFPNAYKNTGESTKKATLEMQSWEGNSLLEKHKTPFGSLSPISPRIKGLKTIEKGREGNLFPFLEGTAENPFQLRHQNRKKLSTFRGRTETSAGPRPIKGLPQLGERHHEMTHETPMPQDTILFKLNLNQNNRKYLPSPPLHTHTLSVIQLKLSNKKWHSTFGKGTRS